MFACAGLTFDQTRNSARRDSLCPADHFFHGITAMNDVFELGLIGRHATRGVGEGRVCLCCFFADAIQQVGHIVGRNFKRHVDGFDTSFRRSLDQLCIGVTGLL